MVEFVRSIVITRTPAHPRSTPTWPFLGQRDLGQHLITSLNANRLPAAILFAGPAEVGKGSAALWLAKFDRCQQSSRPCGTCPSCRQIETGQHPHVQALQGYPKDVIQIETIRQIVTQTQLRFTSTHRTWVLVRDADWMTESASNALLKFLEEPPALVQFILTSSRPDRLLPTIRSRCATYHWHLVSSRDLQSKRTKQIDSKLPAAIARAAGRPGRFMQIQNNPEMAEQERQTISDYLIDWARPTASAQARLIDEAVADPTRIFQLWLLASREVLLHKLGSYTRQLWPTLQSQVERVTQVTELSSIISKMERIQTHLELLAHHVSPKHLATELVLA